MSANSGAPQAPRLSPVKTFICDGCGGIIRDPSTAFGQWFGSKPSSLEESERNWQFSIMHGGARSPQCTLTHTNTRKLGDWQLSFLLSADGLAYLLEFFVTRDVDPEELTCFLMRLFVPGYDEAHRYITYAIAEGVLETKSHRAFLTQAEIGRIIEARKEGLYDTYP